MAGAGKWVGLLAVVQALGCSGADWESFQAQSPYVAPSRLNVQIVARTDGVDFREALDEFWAALSNELEADGIRATYWPAGSPPPPPALFIIVEEWQPGDRGLRWLCGGLGSCGEGSMVVFVDVRAPARLVAGRVRGWVKSGVFGGSSMGAAEAAGTATGEVVARGEDALDPYRRRSHSPSR